MTVIIDYNHEDGTLNEWETNTDATEVTAAAAAALAGTNYGMQVVIDDTTGAYCYRNAIGNASGNFRARFYIDTNSLTMANNNTFTVFSARDSTPDTFVAVDILYTTGGGYFLRGKIGIDAGGYTNATAIAMTDAPHYVEVYIQRATSDVASDGRMDIWVDGAGQQTVTGVDNYDYFENINFVGMGAITGIDAGTSGTFYLDELIVNNDGGYIGILGGSTSPSSSPSSSPSPSASISPSTSPSSSPSISPSTSPSSSASASPSPSTSPSSSPSSSASPSLAFEADDIILEWYSSSPSSSPSNSPSSSSSSSPSLSPSLSPSNSPSSSNSSSPSSSNSSSPSSSNSSSPSSSQSSSNSSSPSSSPSSSNSPSLSQSSSNSQSSSSSISQSSSNSNSPSSSNSNSPSVSPSSSFSSSSSPSSSPSASPSFAPQNIVRAWTLLARNRNLTISPRATAWTLKDDNR